MRFTWFLLYQVFVCQWFIWKHGPFSLHWIKTWSLLVYMFSQHIELSQCYYCVSPSCTLTPDMFDLSALKLFLPVLLAVIGFPALFLAVWHFSDQFSVMKNLIINIVVTSLILFHSVLFIFLSQWAFFRCGSSLLAESIFWLNAGLEGGAVAL